MKKIQSKLFSFSCVRGGSGKSQSPYHEALFNCWNTPYSIRYCCYIYRYTLFCASALSFSIPSVYFMRTAALMHLCV